MLAPDGRCKTFDAAADGFARGEGCGIVVLKRLADAQADGDTIHAIIRGSAVNQDGPSSGLTAPNGPAQEAVIREALRQRRASARARSATSRRTARARARRSDRGPGDRGGLWPRSQQRAAALARLGQDQHRPPRGGGRRRRPHQAGADAAARGDPGAPAFPHAQPAHRLGRAAAERADRRPTPWPAVIGGRRIGGVSSFGFSGTNAHLVLEQAPAPSAARASADAPRPLHLLHALGARSDAALAALARRYAPARLAEPAADLADLCLHRQRRAAPTSPRAPRSPRAACRTARRARLRAGAGEERRRRPARRPMPSDRPAAHRLPVHRPGRAVRGHGRAACYDTQPGLPRRARPLRRDPRPPLPGSPLLEVLFAAGAPTRAARPDRYTQPALFALEYALAELWRSWGIEPAIVLGHSVGEYVAACVAGVFSAGGGAALIAARGRLMQALPAGGGMAAIFADAEPRWRPLRSPAARRWSIAAVNGPEQTVDLRRGRGGGRAGGSAFRGARRARAAPDRLARLPFAAGGADAGRIRAGGRGRVAHACAAHAPDLEPHGRPPGRGADAPATGAGTCARPCSSPTSRWRRSARWAATSSSRSARTRRCSAWAEDAFGDDGPRAGCRRCVASATTGADARAACAALYLAARPSTGAGVRRPAPRSVSAADLSVPARALLVRAHARQAALAGRTGIPLLGTRLRSAVASASVRIPFGAETTRVRGRAPGAGRAILMPATGLHRDGAARRRADALAAAARHARRADLDARRKRWWSTTMPAHAAPCRSCRRRGRRLGRRSASGASRRTPARDVGRHVHRRWGGRRARRREPAESLRDIRAATLRRRRGDRRARISRREAHGPGFRPRVPFGVRAIWRGRGSRPLGEVIARRGAHGATRPGPIASIRCCSTAACRSHRRRRERCRCVVPAVLHRPLRAARPAGARCWAFATLRGGRRPRRARPTSRSSTPTGRVVAELRGCVLKRVAAMRSRACARPLARRSLCTTGTGSSALAEPAGAARPCRVRRRRRARRRSQALRQARAMRAGIDRLRRVPGRGSIACALDLDCARLQRPGLAAAGLASASRPRRWRRGWAWPTASSAALRPPARDPGRGRAAAAREADGGPWRARSGLVVPGAGCRATLAAARYPRAPIARLEMTARCGGELADALRGECDPLQLLFPDGSLARRPSSSIATRLWRGSINGLMARSSPGSWRERPAGPAAAHPRSRRRHRRHHRPRAAAAARRGRRVHLHRYLGRCSWRGPASASPPIPFMRFATLDLEPTPRGAGLRAADYDLVLASNVIHATRDLRRTLARSAAAGARRHAGDARGDRAAALVRSHLRPDRGLVVLQRPRPAPDYPLLTREALADEPARRCRLCGCRAARRRAAVRLRSDLNTMRSLASRRSRRRAVDAASAGSCSPTRRRWARSWPRGLRARGERVHGLRDPATGFVGDGDAVLDPSRTPDYRQAGR